MIKLSKFGAFLITVDSILELLNVTGKNNPISIGLIRLLFGVLIFAIAPQLENDYKVQWAGASLTMQWFSNAFFQGVLGFEWALGIGFIGIVLVIIGAVFVVLGAAIGAIVAQNIGLFKPYRYLFLGLEFITIECTLSFLFKFESGATVNDLIPELFCYSCLGIMALSAALVWKKEKTIGSLCIWIVNNINSAYTGIDGFNAGGITLGLFSFVMAMFAVFNHWADPYKRKTRIPRRDLSMTIKDAYFGFLLGILFALKNRKLKKIEQN